MDKVRIGVLALQGDYEAHAKMIRSLPDTETALIRTSSELNAVQGLIIPGGESTTIGKLMIKHHLLEPIRELAMNGMPLYGTCAGLILMAEEIEGSEQPRLGLLSVCVARNAFGRQVDSFEANIDCPVIGEDPVRGVFIRAPYVTRVGVNAEALAYYEDKVVAVRQNHLLGTAFHPELTGDNRIHSLFREMVLQFIHDTASK
jgi:5'-phosphate synthase pdxT subunit